MAQTLGWAALFVVSAALVVRSGLALAKAGDQLAETTGLGKLWVGTIFLAIATSLPELVTNLSAVRLGAPALAGGNILGANMLNVVVFVALATLFPKAVIQPMGRDQWWLVVTALVLTGLATALVPLGDPANLGPVSLGSLFILGGYVFGMAGVYRTRDVKDEGKERGSPSSAKRAWLLFALAAGGVLVGAPFLAASADRLADILGVSGSFMGVLAVALVTTMPEASVTFGALRLGSEEMALGNVYGSCAFNIFVLGLADFLYPRPLFGLLDRSHLVAGLGALALMAVGPLFLFLRIRKKLALSGLVALTVLGVWAVVMFLVWASAPRAGP